MDHDYTPYVSAKIVDKKNEEDELAKTLSILDGGEELPPKTPAPQTVQEPVSASKVPSSLHSVKVKIEPQDSPKASDLLSGKCDTSKQGSSASNEETPKIRQRAKSLSVAKSHKSITKHLKIKQEKLSDDENYGSEDDFDIDFNDDDNDSDFELEEDYKPKLKRGGRRVKSESKPPKSPKLLIPKKELKLEIKDKSEIKLEKVESTKDKALEQKAPETPTDKKTIIKKEKKTPKPIPDDFALFSTPDIIRRVGGKEPQTPTEPSPTKPARIVPERSRNSSESSHSPTKQERLSVDAKICGEAKGTKNVDKSKDRRPSLDKSKRTSIDEKTKIEPKAVEVKKVETRTKSTEQMDLDSIANSMLMNDQTDASAPIGDFNQTDDNLNLDGTGLIDQTLLDNLNNDLIPEDILYQVAKSLVDNTELQNVIDKGINEGNLVLDPTMQEQMTIDPNIVQNNTAPLQVNNSGLIKHV